MKYIITGLLLAMLITALLLAVCLTSPPASAASIMSEFDRSYGAAVDRNLAREGADTSRLRQSLRDMDLEARHQDLLDEQRAILDEQRATRIQIQQFEQTLRYHR